MSPTQRPAVVYAITSRGNDFHSVMTRASAVSVRLSNPGLPIVLAVDAQTDRDLQAAGDPLLGVVDERVVVPTVETDRLLVNRSVKLQLRSVLAGDLLFLDSDTLVRGSLAPVLGADAEVAGARNHSRPVRSEQVSARDQRALEALGWATRPEAYVNGGLLLMRDTPAARAFAEDWHARWLLTRERCNDHRDQPSLNAALQAMAARFCLLEDRFNAQFRPTPGVASGAVVWHYYASRAKHPLTGFELLVERVLGGTPLEESTVRKLLELDVPWHAENRVDRYVAARIERKGRMRRFDKHWLRRQPVRAGLCWLLGL